MRIGDFYPAGVYVDRACLTTREVLKKAAAVTILALPMLAAIYEGTSLAGSVAIAEIAISMGYLVKNGLSFTETIQLPFSLFKCAKEGKKPSFSLAYKNHDVSLLKFFKALGANVNEKDDRGETLLHKAAANGEVEKVKVLLEMDADANAKDVEGKTPLHRVLQSNTILLNPFLAGTVLQTIKALVSSGANPFEKDANGKAPLFYAAKQQDFYAINGLFNSGRLVSDVLFAENRNSMLHYAIEINHPEYLEALLKAGANPIEKNDRGKTPLYMAVKTSNMQAVEILLNAGHNVNEENRDGKTPLHVAIRDRIEKAVEILLREGASPNIQDEKGETPLHLASFPPNIEMIKLLIAHGADRSIQNKLGLTPDSWLNSLGVINEINQWEASRKHG